MQSVVLQFVTLHCHNKKSDRNITPQTAIGDFMTDKCYDHNKLFRAWWSGSRHRRRNAGNIWVQQNWIYIYVAARKCWIISELTIWAIIHLYEAFAIVAVSETNGHNWNIWRNNRYPAGSDKLSDNLQTSAFTHLHLNDSIKNCRHTLKIQSAVLVANRKLLTFAPDVQYLIIHHCTYIASPVLCRFECIIYG